jgi:hypothetical protein
MMGLFSGKLTTVDGVLTPLLKIITDLEKVSTERDDLAVKHRYEAEVLLVKAKDDVYEATRARSVLVKLHALTEE